MSAILTHHNGIRTVHTRTEKGLAFDAFVKDVRQKLRGMTAHERDVLKTVNVEFLRCLRDPQFRADFVADSAQRSVLTPHSVHSDQFLADLSVRYANDNFIGKRLMPEVRVPKLSGKFAIHDKRDRLAGPDDKIGPRGKANEITAGSTEGTYVLEDRALLR